MIEGKRKEENEEKKEKGNTGGLCGARPNTVSRIEGELKRNHETSLMITPSFTYTHDNHTHQPSVPFLFSLFPLHIQQGISKKKL